MSDIPNINSYNDNENIQNQSENSSVISEQDKYNIPSQRSVSPSSLIEPSLDIGLLNTNPLPEINNDQLNNNLLFRINQEEQNEQNDLIRYSYIPFSHSGFIPHDIYGNPILEPLNRNSININANAISNVMSQNNNQINMGNNNNNNVSNVGGGFVNNSNANVNSNNVINNNNYYSNSESMFEEYPNEEGYYQEVDYGSNADEVFNNLSIIINNEKEKIKQDREKISNLQKQFANYQREYIKKYNKKILDWRDSITNKRNTNFKDTDIIEINIGGCNNYSLKREILTRFPNSVLAVCFSGQVELPKKDGSYFIDRDSKYFEMVIYYLKTLTFPAFKSNIDEQNFYNELNFWKIPIKTLPPNYTFDKEWCAETLMIENSGKTLKKRNINHGVVFLKPKMNAFTPYFKFKISIGTPCKKNKSILFMGLVDISKYKKKYLLSTYWKESPSSFYWDICNMQLIKTDEKGAQVITKSGYGCGFGFDESEAELAMMYNQQNQTLTFYKNDINLGVAFHDVPQNLTPSIDAWFESGTIKIIDAAGPEEKIFL